MKTAILAALVVGSLIGCGGPVCTEDGKAVECLDKVTYVPHFPTPADDLNPPVQISDPTKHYIPTPSLKPTPLPDGFYQCFTDPKTGAQHGCVWCPIDSRGIDCMGLTHLGHVGFIPHG